MKPFSLLIKPASADCNLRCSYCFYLGHHGFYPESAIHRMSDEVLERMVSSYMATEQPQYAFGWQGGEPTLMGVEFFRKVVALQKKHGRQGSTVANGLQTNATLVTDEMAGLFAEYQFLLGVSLDGPAELHDCYRTHGNGKPSHADVLRGLGVLERHGVAFNILTLVNNRTGSHPVTIYKYLRDRGCNYHQYIPCVEYDAGGQTHPFSVGPEQWGDFLCGVFDEWYAHDTRNVSVRLFDSILMYLATGERNICHMGRNCCQYYVVEYNGDIFPCDFFVEKQLRIGNVMSLTWDEAAVSSAYRDFGARKAQWHRSCENCSWLEFCSGDCLKHRLPGAAAVPSHLCVGWRRFFGHAIPRLKKLAGRIVEERAAPPGEPRRGEPRRNDPCPCGSGLKYKKCCMGAGATGRRA